LHRAPHAGGHVAVDRRSRGAHLFFKCENLQRSGSFKFRGAYNALSRLSPDEAKRGVVTFSSGNHAQAIALAGRCSISRVIVMPSDAPAVKRTATAGYGGEIVLYDRDRETVSDRPPAARSRPDADSALRSPAHHRRTGHAARELFEDVGPLDFLFTPCGGGGLLSGTAIAARAASTNCKVIGVEPAAGDDANRSFRSKTLQTVHNPKTVADGARTPSLGTLTFPLVLDYVSDMAAIDDPTLLRTMFYLWERLKLVVEPTGALGAAAALESTQPIRGKRVGVILSGGNVDLTQVSQWIGVERAAAALAILAVIAGPLKPDTTHEASSIAPSCTWRPALAGPTSDSRKNRARRAPGRRSPSCR
jgi:threonine dehydratase